MAIGLSRLLKREAHKTCRSEGTIYYNGEKLADIREDASTANVRDIEEKLAEGRFVEL